MPSSKRKAVALKYIEGTEAPVILAKGQGKMAEVMLAEAEKSGVPVTEDKVLVDMLGLVSAGDTVPENTWQALAVIFSFILSDKDKDGKRGH